MADSGPARPRSCPGCHSIGAPSNGCIDPWHGTAPWDAPLGVQDVAGAHSSGRAEPADHAWAGTGFEGRKQLPVASKTVTAWHCLECPRCGSYRDPREPREMAEGHARERRHMVQMMTTKIWIPAEKEK